MSYQVINLMDEAPQSRRITGEESPTNPASTVVNLDESYQNSRNYNQDETSTYAATNPLQHMAQAALIQAEIPASHSAMASNNALLSRSTNLPANNKYTSTLSRVANNLNNYTPRNAP
jgi:hypothetical protein